MDAELRPVVAALADLADGELQALADTTNGVPQTAPGLLAWIEHACDWELNRRRGVDYELQPPGAAIPPEEYAVSIDAAMALRATFVQDAMNDVRVVHALFDAIVGLLTGSDRRH